MANTINIPFDKNIEVASNELFLRATINRNLEKLLKNDLALAEKIDKYGTDSDFSIQIYKDTRIYNKGDVILYSEFNEDQTEIKSIYLLESISSNNTTPPSYEIIDTYVKDFSKSGWKEINPLFSIYNSSDEALNISSFLEYSISSKLYLSHEIDAKYHKYGEISESTLSSKLLLKDLSNISDSRSQLFWGYETGKYEIDKNVGTYKKWGNGVLEYDIAFSLNNSIQTEKTIAADGSILETNYIKANSLIPLSCEENDNYFLNSSAYTIFNQKGSNEKYIVNGIAQTNVKRQVNVYHGKISFPIPFVNTDYMVFANSYAEASGISQSPNTLTFINREKESITPIFIIPNYNDMSIGNVLLQNNTFQCQIIGRWK